MKSATDGQSLALSSNEPRKRNVVGSSRSHTPPHGYPNGGSRPQSSSSSPSLHRSPTPKRSPYGGIFSGSTSTLNAGEDDDDENGLEADEGEDEFGLPSISSSTRGRHGRQPPQRTKHPGRTWNGPGPASAHSYPRLDTGDISEERSLPNYPNMKKGEGKILRPQYKDILRGRSPRSSLGLRC